MSASWLPVRGASLAVLGGFLLCLGCAPNSGRSGTSTPAGGSSSAATTATGGRASSSEKTHSGGGSGQGGAAKTGGSQAGDTTGASSKGGGPAGGASGGAAGQPGSSAGGAGGGTGSSSAQSPLIGDVMFSTPSQTFKSKIDVEMTTTIDGAEIRYAIDGQLPTASSTLYKGAVTFTSTTQVRAQAFVGGAAKGRPSTGIYIARTIDPTSDIPIMIVEGYGKGKPTDKDVYFDAAVMVWEPVNGVAAMAALPTLVMRAGYHVRGQSSASFPQTPYKIELWDNQNKDFDVPLLGMPSESDWALIPPYYDRTLLRNPFTFELGKDMGMQAPRTAFAEVYINNAAHAIGEADYQGIYWVTETIKNNKVRTNLKQLDESDTTLPKISGGYIFKFDQAAAEEPKLVCTGSDPIPGMGGIRPGTGGTSGRGGTCWTDLEVVDPDPLNGEQQAWLTQYIQELHDTLHRTPIGDYAKYIDVPSFIDHLIISELTYNVDAYTRSSYYHKDRDGKLKAGPLWDYNFALGGVGAMKAAPTGSETGWRFSGTRNVNNWYPKLTADPAFMAQVKTRYQNLRSGLLSDNALLKRMNDRAAPLKQAVVRDFAKWPVESIIKSTSGFLGGPTAPTWEGQLEVMRTFITARLAWMDANLK